MNPATPLSRPAFALLILALALSPLPLASNRPLFCGLLIAVAGAVLIFTSLRGPLVLPWRGMAVALLALALGCVSSGTGVLLLLAYLVFFALAAMAGRTPQMADKLLNAFALTSLAYGIYALGVYATGNTHVLLWPKTAYLHDATGTFINRNAFAAFCGMGLLANTAVLVRCLIQPRRWLMPLLALLACLVLLACLLLSHSRAGLLSTAMGGAVFLMLLAVRRSLPGRTLAGLTLAGGLSALALFALLGGGLLSRLDSAGLPPDERGEIWRTTTEMIAQAPLFGHGIGSFEGLLLRLQPGTLHFSYNHAHNVWLETAAEMGLPATLCAFAFFCWLGLRLARSTELYAMLALAVLTQAALHSFVDFSFQMPANAVWLALLLGLGTAPRYSKAAKG